MEIRVLSAHARCVMLELENGLCYSAAQPFTVALNGEMLYECTTNVFGLYQLTPNTSYTVTLWAEGQLIARQSVKTREESFCLNVLRFGAVGDGKTDCTLALQAALHACPPKGTVYVPQGVFLTYPLFIPSGVTLYLDRNAVLRGGTDRDRYPVLPGVVQNDEARAELPIGTWEGNPLDCYASLITAIHSENIAIVGQGTIDGDAANGPWWQSPKEKAGAWRPRTLFFSGCKQVTVLGVSIVNSPSWTVHPYYSENVDILGLRIQNPWDSPNTDGCNPESCRNVRIIGCNIQVGDDCIAIKSGKYYMSAAHYQPVSHLTIRNCYLGLGHGAVVVGSEIASGLEDLHISQCCFENTDRGLRIKTRRGRGDKSIVDHILFENIHMKGVLSPLVVNMFYFCDPDGHSQLVRDKRPQPVDKRTPTVGHITLRGIRCEGCSYAGIFLYGLPERPIRSVKLEDVEISFAPDAKEGYPAMMDDIEPFCREALLARNVEKLSLKNVRFQGQKGQPPFGDGAYVCGGEEDQWKSL